MSITEIQDWVELAREFGRAGDYDAYHDAVAETLVAIARARRAQGPRAVAGVTRALSRVRLYVEGPA